MSFSNSIREEITNIKIYKKDEIFAFLYAAIIFCGNITITKDKLSFCFATENIGVAKKISYLFKKIFTISLEIYQKSNYNFGRKKVYILKYPKELNDAKNILTKLYILDIDNDVFNINTSIKKDLLSEENVIKSFLRAVYITAGSITDPEKGYHLEFTSHNLKQSEDLLALLKDIGIKSNITKRKDNYITYIKDSESISDFLNLVGAHNCMFKFEDIRIEKQMRNNVNRIVNCETANLSKIVKTYIRQKNAIEYIIKRKGLDFLNEELKELAILRLNNNDISLKELGEKLSTPISKSGVNYRLNRIEQIANKLYEEENNVKKGSNDNKRSGVAR